MAYIESLTNVLSYKQYFLLEIINLVQMGLKIKCSGKH